MIFERNQFLEFIITFFVIIQEKYNKFNGHQITVYITNLDFFESYDN